VESPSLEILKNKTLIRSLKGDLNFVDLTMQERRSRGMSTILWNVMCLI